MKKVTTLISVLALAIPVFTAPSASAETFVFQSAPLTNLDPAGATINGGFTKFTTKGGMYMQQCIAPVAGARPGGGGGVAPGEGHGGVAPSVGGAAAAAGGRHPGSPGGAGGRGHRHGSSGAQVGALERAHAG